MSRRNFLRGAGIATVGTLGALARPAAASVGRQGRAPRRPTVAVFGGGIAGLTAAHELSLRGFDVTVFEKRAWGGKARSTIVPGTGTGGRRHLPGEHAYRVPFGCYQNLPDTMKRIPFGSNPRGVFDNLVPVPEGLVARQRQHNLFLPFGVPAPQRHTAEHVLDTIVGLMIDMEIPPAAASYFASRMAVYFSSCEARRDSELEAISWDDFIRSGRYPGAYQEFFGEFPRFAQAAKPHDCNAKYLAWVFGIWIIYSLLGRGTNGPTLRVLDAPTNEAWIDPWISELTRLGAHLRLGYALTGFDFDDRRITGVRLAGPFGAQRVVADWYVCALPVEQARRFWTSAMLEADPTLAEMIKLGTDWMNGVMYYLDERTDIVQGIAECADSPWAVSFIPQAQFWKKDFASTYGDGRVRDKISAAIADWSTRGVLFGKPARECTPAQVAAECWEQIKRHINKSGEAPRVTDDMLVSWNIDPGMTTENGHLVSQDPLILPTKGTQRFRPDVETAIPNLVLCGDYLRGPWEVANMEAPNYNGRRAANAILERSGSHESPATTLPPYRPPEWEPLRRLDEDRYRHGEPNLFDGDRMAHNHALTP